MNPAVQPADASPWEVIRALRRSRPRSRLVRASALCLALLVAASWFSVLDEPGALLSPRRRANLSRFIAQEALPAPLRESTAALSTRLAEALELDSIRMLTLVVELENHFDICLEEGDEEGVETVGDLVAVLLLRLA